MAQIAATALGVEMSCLKLLTGDTDKVPYGGGTWASRAAGIGGEAVLQAGGALKKNILEVRAGIPQTSPGRRCNLGRQGGEKSTEQGPTPAQPPRRCYFPRNKL